MSRITVNGQPRDTAAADIAALVVEFGCTNGAMLIEHNGTALRPAEWSACAIQEGDRIELLRIAAGG